MAVPLINGVVHNFASIDCLVAGVPLYSMNSISYKDAQDIEDVPGMGYFAVGRSFSSVKPEGSIKLQLADVQKLVLAAPNGRVQQLPFFDIVVTYIPFGSTDVIVHTLLNCTIKENGVDASQGDMTIEVELPLAIGFIQWKPGASPIV